MDEKMKSVITCDLDGKLETFSEGAEKLFGYTSDEIIGKGRVSDFSDGQIVLGHVVNWLKEAVEKGAWEGDTVFCIRMVQRCLVTLKSHQPKIKIIIKLVIVVLQPS